MNETRIITVADCGADERVDAWLARHTEGMSRSRIQQLIGAGHVTIGGKAVKGSRRVREGETIALSIPPPRSARIAPEALPLNVLFEDAHLLVVDKPPGMVVHPAPGHASGTLVNAVLARCPELGGVGGELRPGIVHRLDKDTSGVAKNERALAGLAAQFKLREVRKEYIAVVCGLLEPAAGVIETLIGRHASDRKKMAVVARRGREASTVYRTIERLGDYSLVRLHPRTGRTHQIRVHLAHLGRPVAGDLKYGGRAARCAGAARQMLHAANIGFRHPADGRAMEFQAPLPEDMARFVDNLRGREKGT